jgi:acyl dehydratase
MAMALNLDAVGATAEPFTVHWTADDTMLYALGVGAGQGDALAELHLTTENTAGVELRALPTFGIPLVQSGLLRRLPVGDFDRSKLVHADQGLEVHTAINASGSAEVHARVDGIYDKRRGALIAASAEARDPRTGAPMWTSRFGYFVRGEGGFDGDDAPDDGWVDPGTSPDHVIETATGSNQGLLYRLVGDRNPLHSDPTYAMRAGFPRPILHGLCTYGMVHRALLATQAAGDVSRVRGTYARFSRPVFPGTVLRTEMWVTGPELRFRTRDAEGRIVLDRGRLRLDDGPQPVNR